MVIKKIKLKPQMQLEMIPCSTCGEDMPELRKTKYGYNFCVKCSEGGNMVSRKKGVPIQFGEGDHTWTETIIMEESDYNKYLEHRASILGRKTQSKAEIIDMDENFNSKSKILNSIKDEEDE